MIVQRFLEWAATAPAAQRAEGAGALARAFLYSGLDTANRQAAEAALTLMLDDNCVDVRRSIAEALAPSLLAPHHIILALAHDSPEIAVPVLILSPALTDSELIDILPVRGEEEQSAIAARESLSPAVAAAIAEIGTPLACAVLARNPQAAITPRTSARLVERHGGEAIVRDALLDRSDLPIGERQKLLLKLAERLGHTAVMSFSLDEERVRRMTQDACERATLALIDEEPSAVRPLVMHLRRTGQLTTALVLRALLNGDLDFVEAAFSELTQVPLERVRRMLEDPRQAGFRALYNGAGFPQTAFAPFREALDAWADLRDCGVTGAAARRHVAERALSMADIEELGGAAELMKRMAADAARELAMDTLRAETQRRLVAA
ncbi:hypothetical protein IZ6_20130 [Terrihabitans soli]|uniref:DUF2336 domain-containing protein n=1 Tax=Terrihabitans soli TaxID=708113 RepID=A0A6S6QXI6_9HYPH|nr:DUF2336 domain-containing protein [Terrihabitans soli]BCJ91278.1 hypothetical protein IZ6_20130 [Terrihabitans soli]